VIIPRHFRRTVSRDDTGDKQVADGLVAINLLRCLLMAGRLHLPDTKSQRRRSMSDQILDQQKVNGQKKIYVTPQLQDLDNIKKTESKVTTTVVETAIFGS